MNAEDKSEDIIIKILVVEDNPGDFLIIKEMLKKAEYTKFKLERASRLKNGLEYLQETKFDAIILDLELPDSKGLETFLQVLSRHPEIPILILTGLADEETGINAVKQGAQDYLVKGEFDGKLLVRSITYAIERKRLEGLFSYHINR